MIPFNFAATENNEAAILMKNDGFRHTKKRGRRVILGTDDSSNPPYREEVLRAFKDWCTSPEMQVVCASFMPLLAMS